MQQLYNMSSQSKCLCCSCIASFVKEITLPFSKVKSWLKKQNQFVNPQSLKLEDEDVQKLEKLLM